MEIRTIKSFEELEKVRTYWEDWQFHPNSDFAHFQIVCRLIPEVKYPYVAVVERERELKAILAARMEQTHFSASFGYYKLFKVPAKVIIVIYRGLLGENDDEVCESLFRHLWSCLCAGEADAVILHHLPGKSPLLGAVLNSGTRVWCEKRPGWSPHWAMHLPLEPGSIFESLKAKHRRHIRGKERKLNSKFSDKISWRWMKRFEDVPKFCGQLEQVAKQTYQRGLEAGFVNNEGHRRRFELFASRGQLRAQVLEIQNRIRAFWIGTVYNNVFYASETGYDPDLRNFEIGTIGFLKTVDDLAREGIQKVDFGFGDSAFKQRFGNQCWEEATVRFFAPTIKGFLLRSYLSGSKVLDKVAHRLVQKAGVLDRIKKYWRSRLAATPPKK